MFSKIKNFFKKQILENNENTLENIEEENLLSSMLCYYSDVEGNVSVDVELSDFSKETVSNFARIISGVCSFRFHLETIEIIKSAFLSAGKEDMFDYFLQEVIKISKEDLLRLKEISGDYSEEDPCVKPSDML